MNHRRSLAGIFAALGILLILGCGGGGNPPQTPAAPTTYTVSGTVTGAVQNGVTITMGSLVTTTSTNGSYTFTGVANGSYTVVPSLSGYTFNPTSAPAVVNGGNVTVQNFVATAVIVPPQSHTVSGVVTGDVKAGVTITLGNLSTVTATNGTYSFTNVANGTYTATATLANYTFAPTSTSVVVNGADVSNVNFVATAVIVPPGTHTVSGVVTGDVKAGVTITLGNLSTVTATNGTYSFTNVANGTYTATATLANFTFAPTSTSVVVNADVSNVNFVATAVIIPPQTHTISGSITKSGTVSTLGGVTVTAGELSAVTGTNGKFSFANLASGSYILTPSLAGWTFSPASVTVNLDNADVTVYFVATAILSNAFSMYWMRITPNAVFDDAFNTTPIVIEASVSGTGFTLYSTYFQEWFDNTLPEGYTRLIMTDTGVSDTNNPGATIYVVSFTPSMAPRLRDFDHTVDYFPIFLEADDASGKALQSVFPMNQQVRLGIVSRSLAVSTTQVASDVFVASNMVNIVVPTLDRFDPTTVMKKVYQYYPDVFHTSVIQCIRRTIGSNVEGGAPVKNIVSGINDLLFDSSSGWGSNGILLSVEYLLPDDTIGQVFLHEFGHSACFLLNLPELNLTASGGDHAALIGTVGQMGGNYLLVEQTSGDFMITRPDPIDYTSRKFSNLELYLLGFAPPSAVAPMRFDFGIKDIDIRPGAIIPSASTTLVLIDDIVRVYGARTPAFADSQKSLRAVWVGVSETPMTPAEVALLNRIAIFYASDAVGGDIDTLGLGPVRSMLSFKAATSGVGTLITVLPPTNVKQLPLTVRHEGADGKLTDPIEASAA